MTRDHSFECHRIQQAIQAMRAVTPRSAAASSAALGGPSRRRFLQAGAAGALAASLPLLSACGGGDSSGGGDSVTLFFNYSHLDHQGKSMSIQVGRDNYRLRPVAEVPDVLARERRQNRFLS